MFIPGHILEEFLFRDADKRWFVYVKYFTYSIQKKCILSESTIKVNVAVILKHMHGKSRVFYKKSVYSYLLNLDHTRISVTATSPIGYGQASGTPIINKYAEKTWKFRLNKYFSINLTITHLYLSANNFKKCLFGNLYIEEDYIGALRYWGIRSHISHFSRTHEINVQLNVMRYVIYNVSLTFNVMDSKRIYMWTPDDFKTGQYISKERLKFILPNKDIFLHCYYFAGTKWKNLKITLDNEIINSTYIHDGPGVLSRQLKPYRIDKNYGYFKSSTFHCAF